MSIFYDLKRTLLQKFLELVPTAVAGEVVFSTPVTAVGTTGKECFVTLTAGTESRTFAVDRSDLAVLFQSHDPVLTPIDTTSDVAMLRELTQKLSARFGLPLEANDIADLKLPKPYGTVHVKASAESVRYKGEFKAHVIFGDMPQYPIPFHEFLFNDNSIENTGTSLLPLALGFQQTSADPLLVSFPQIGLLGNNVSIDLSSSFTLDFVVKLPSITGDLVLFSTDPTATTLTTPAFGFRNGRFCLFNDTDFTVDGAWDKASVAVAADTPTRITLRCLNGSATLAIDGAAQGNFPITDQTAKLYGIGTSDPAYVIPTTSVSIGSLRYWASGLSESSMNALLGDSYNALMPDHWWPFNGDYSNIGTSGLPWLAPMTFVDVSGKTMAVSNSANGAAFGAEFDMTKDFTLQFEYQCSGTSSGWEGMFSTSNLTANIPGQLKFWNGAFEIQGHTILSNWTLIRDTKVHTITIMGVGGAIYIWIDGYSPAPPMGSTLAQRLKLTHFGKAVQSLSTRHRIANLKFWGKSFTNNEELAEIVGPTAKWAVQQYGGYTGLAGATVGMDGATNTFFNNTYKPTITGNVPEAMVGKRIFGIRYWFNRSTTNYKKKLQTIRVDKSLDNVNYVTHETVTAKWCTTDTLYPDYEDLLFATPLVLTNTKFRIYGASNYGDQYGYYWITEIAFLYDDDAPRVLPLA